MVWVPVSHGATMNNEAFVRQCEAICKRGFANEHAWIAWLRIREKQIFRLPQPLQARVMAAHANSGPKGL